MTRSTAPAALSTRADPAQPRPGRRHAASAPRGGAARFHGAVLAAVLGFGALSSAPASAVVYCVGTVDELRNAVTAIEQDGGDDFDLRIRSGYYPLTLPAGQPYALRIRRSFFGSIYRTGQHRISGAWNAGCSQQAETLSAATSTLLDGQNQGGILTIQSVSNSYPTERRQHIAIDRLQFANAGAGINSACLFLNTLQIAGSHYPAVDVTVDRIRAELCDGGALRVQIRGQVTVRNSVFLANQSQTYPALSVSGYEASAAVYNNTLRYNRQSADALAAQMQVGGTVTYVYNNIIADGGYSGGIERALRMVGGTAFVRNNRFVGTVTHSTGGAIVQSGNVPVQPGFVGPHNHRLAANSPLRDLGLADPPGNGLGPRDYEGNLRVQGAAPEMGAFELPPIAFPDRIFANGFQSQ